MVAKSMVVTLLWQLHYQLAPETMAAPMMT